MTMDDYTHFSDTRGCLLDLFKIIGIVLAIIFLIYYLVSCKPYNSTTRAKNGHPHLYQKSKYQ